MGGEEGEVVEAFLGQSRQLHTLSTAPVRPSAVDFLFSKIAIIRPKSHSDLSPEGWSDLKALRARQREQVAEIGRSARARVDVLLRLPRRECLPGLVKIG